jgi:Cyclic nucleotide-binding domain/Major Facilitator Superfamily
MRVWRGLAANTAVLRVLAAYTLFTLTEYTVWIAMLVYAYGRGGAATAGVVAVVQLAPAAVVAPLAASVADRRSPLVLLAGGYLTQAIAMGGTAAAMAAGLPLAAYAGAVVAGTAVTATRPAQSALLPSVAVTPDQLTAANVVAGWLEAAGIAAAGLMAGALISAAAMWCAFAVCAALGLLAALLVARLRTTAADALGPAAGTRPPEITPAATEATIAASTTAAATEPDADAAGVRTSLRLAFGQRRLRLMLALLTADAVMLGGLDLLFVIVARAVLGRPPGWAGYLQFAVGAGAILAATVSAVLVGRRLGGPILSAALAFSGALAAVAFGPGVAGTVILLAIAGAGHSLLELATRTLMQRSVPPRLIGRVFGFLEGLTMAGLALGAMLVPVLVYLGGSRLAVLGVAAVLPLAAVAGGRAVLRLDAGTAVPVVEISLLRALPLFAELPAPAIESLAAALRPVQLSAGEALIREGDPGNAYYAIAAGELDATRGGQFLNRLGRGEGVGEIALLRAVPRTATVTARTAATVYRLDRDPFLAAVLGHAPTRRHADRITITRLATAGR